MDIVRDFGRAARNDKALIGELIRMMAEFLNDEKDSLVQWEMETEMGTLCVTFSTDGSQADMFTEDGEGIPIEGTLGRDLERCAEKIMDEAREDAEEGIEDAQAIEETEEALCRMR